jgi:hypothetical protein
MHGHEVSSDLSSLISAMDATNTLRGHNTIKAESPQHPVFEIYSILKHNGTIRDEPTAMRYLRLYLFLLFCSWVRLATNTPTDNLEYEKEYHSTQANGTGNRLSPLPVIRGPSSFSPFQSMWYRGYIILVHQYQNVG